MPQIWSKHLLLVTVYLKSNIHGNHEPYDEARPIICFDESSKALRGDEHDPLVSITVANAAENSDSTSPPNR